MLCKKKSALHWNMTKFSCDLIKKWIGSDGREEKKMGKDTLATSADMWCQVWSVMWCLLICSSQNKQKTSRFMARIHEMLRLLGINETSCL